MRTQQIMVWAAVGIAVMSIAGCRIESDKHGDNNNVKISTPFGGMQVKTDDSVTLENLGLAAYPGAQAVKHGKDGGPADVNMNFGSFQLRVKVVNYRTGDAPDKVEAFYRTELKQLGDVIACRDGSAVGTPTQTIDGLTCDKEVENHVTVDNHLSKTGLELKTGSKLHQHIVEIDADGSGTKFSLVALDLPGKMTSGSENDDRRQ